MQSLQARRRFPVLGRHWGARGWLVDGKWENRIGGGGKRGKLRELEGLTLNNWAGEVFFVK